jgi:hypothetical protein
MGQVKRSEAVNPARNIGRRDAIKKRCRGQTMFFSVHLHINLAGIWSWAQNVEKVKQEPLSPMLVNDDCYYKVLINSYFTRTRFDGF